MVASDKECFMMTCTKKELGPAIGIMAICAGLAFSVGCKKPEETASPAADGGGETAPASAPPVARTAAVQEGPQTMEALVAAYVSAVNNDDRDALESLLHSKCRACIGDENRDFYDVLFSQYVVPTIPEDYETTFEPIPPGEPLPYENMSIYPVRPSHTFTLQFTEDVGRPASILNQIVNEGGVWTLMIPCPTEEVLTSYRESLREAEQARERAELLVSQLTDPLRSELVDLLQQGQRMAAVGHYGAATGESPAVAEAVVDLLARPDAP
jgi:hypothetical protein